MGKVIMKKCWFTRLILHMFIPGICEAVSLTSQENCLRRVKGPTFILWQSVILESQAFQNQFAMQLQELHLHRMLFVVKTPNPMLFWIGVA